MAESSMILFSFQELAEMMVKQQGIHEGLWGIYLRFGIGAANAGDPTGTLYPTALVPVKEIGLQKFEEANNLSIDASKVNPTGKTATARTKATKSKRKRT
jgi:hypothetical protein